MQARQVLYGCAFLKKNSKIDDEEGCIVPSCLDGWSQALQQCLLEVVLFYPIDVDMCNSDDVTQQRSGLETAFGVSVLTYVTCLLRSPFYAQLRRRAPWSSLPYVSRKQTEHNVPLFPPQQTEHKSVIVVGTVANYFSHSFVVFCILHFLFSRHYGAR